MDFDSLLQDVRVAWRGLAAARGFSAAATLTLAAGITGTIVMFALVQGVLLRPLPVHDEQQLLVAWKRLPASGLAHYPLRIAEVEAIGREVRTLRRIAAVGYNGAVRSPAIEGDAVGDISVALVSGAFFEVMNVRPSAGRVLTAADDIDGAEPALAISHALWQRRYGGAADTIGRTIVLDEQRFRIVGVLPPDFEYPRGTEVWRTLKSVSTAEPFGEYARRDVDLVARLAPGATLAEAEQELRALLPRLEIDRDPDAPRGLVPVVASFRDLVVGDVRVALLVLLAAVALVLFVACANTSNLLLVRGEARRTELAVRAALGAGSGRLARLVLIESALLSLAAGALGLGAAWWALPVLVRFVPQGLPRAESVRLDGGVVLFTVAVAFVAATLAGLGPALASSRADLARHLRDGSRGATAAGSRRRRALVALQAGLAVAVVAAAGLLVRTLVNLQSVEMGLAADRLMLVQLAVPAALHGSRDRHLQLLDALVARLEAAPGVEAATPVNTPPFSGTGGWDVPRFTADGQTAAEAGANPSLNLESVHSNYFSTLGIRIVRGRAFTPEDRAGSLDVAIVTEDVAARAWPDSDPVGRRIKMGPANSTDRWRTVVGVVAATRYRDLPVLRPTLYLPAEQFLVTAQALIVRSSLPTRGLGTIARHEVAAVHPAVAVVRVAPFSSLLDAPLARPRFTALLISLFGAVALLLASVGLYAVTAADVRRRQVEFGVRIALGATPSDVRRQVLREGLILSAAGALAGLLVAAAAGRMLRGLLFGVEPLDAGSMSGAAVLLVTAAIAACYLPARRATRIDPIVLLRSDGA